MSRVRLLVGLIAFPLAALLAPAAHAEVSPGNSDMGYKVYEITDPGGGASKGMLVVIGSANVPASGNTQFAAGTQYWIWTTPNGTGKYCYVGANATPFPASSFGLKLQFAGTTGGESDPWAISSLGVVKGCKSNSSQARVVSSVAMSTQKSNFQPTQPGATALWTVTTSNNSGDGNAWIAPHTGGGQDLGFAWKVTPNGDGSCPNISPAPWFTVPAGGTISFALITTAPTLTCGQTATDLVP